MRRRIPIVRLSLRRSASIRRAHQVLIGRRLSIHVSERRSRSALYIITARVQERKRVIIVRALTSGSFRRDRRVRVVQANDMAAFNRARVFIRLLEAWLRLRRSHALASRRVLARATPESII